MGRGVQKSKRLSQLNGLKNSELQEEDDLHNPILLSLNIQHDTSARSRTNNRISLTCMSIIAPHEHTVRAVRSQRCCGNPYGWKAQHQQQKSYHEA